MIDPRSLPDDELMTAPLRIAIVGMACGFSRAIDLAAYWQSVVRGPVSGREGGPILGDRPGDGDDEPLSTSAAISAALADARRKPGEIEARRARAYVVPRGGMDRNEQTPRQREQVADQVLAILRSLHPGWDGDDSDALRRELMMSPPALDPVPIEAVSSPASAIAQAARALAENRTDLGVAVEEAGAAVVLKRLDDAVRDRDRVYAILQTFDVTSDLDETHFAISSPRRIEGAIQAARGDARVAPTSAPKVEQSKPWTSRRAPLPRSLSDRGVHHDEHAQSAGPRGMTDLINTALALHHRVLLSTDRDPSTNGMGVEKSTDLRAISAARPWIHGPATPRRAGVAVPGLRGAVGHGVLEEHRPEENSDLHNCLLDWESEAVLLGAADRESWVALASALLGWLDSGRNAQVKLKDLAFTLNAGQGSFPFRVGMVVATIDELKMRLRQVSARLDDPQCQAIREARGVYFWSEPLAGQGRLAFLYPGEGSQYPGMLADLCIHFPEVRAVLDTADRIARDRGLTRLPSEQLFGNNSADDSGLFAVETAVNVVLSSNWAIHGLLKTLGLEPDAVLGHSSGEFLSLAAANVLEIDQILETRLGELAAIFEGMEREDRIPSATLLAAAADRDRVEAILRAIDSPARIVIDNCPHQVVLSGSSCDIETISNVLNTSGILCEVLPFSRAYHSSAFAPALDALRVFFQGVPFRAPSIPIYSCATGLSMPGDVDSIRALAIEQWVSRVRFRSTIEAMYDDGIRLFVEVGARGNLSGYVADILRHRPHFAVSANIPGRSGTTQLNHLVASLYAQGVRIDPRPLYARRHPHAIDLSRDLPEPDHATPTRVHPAMRLSEALATRLRARFSDRPTPEERATSSIFVAAAAHDSSAADVHNGPSRRNGPPPMEPAAATPIRDSRQDTAVHEDDPNLRAFFETMDEFLETQRAVMQAYLAKRVTEDGPVADSKVIAGAGGEVLSASTNGHVATSGLSAANEGSRASATGNGAASLDLREVLLEQVSLRTGYPRSMLDLDLDMEGDLGIDSIKRVEILGEVESRNAAPGQVPLDRLTRCRTLGQVIELLEGPPLNGTAPHRQVPLPGWPGEIESFTAGREVVAIRLLDAKNDPVASQHTLGGRRISDDEPGRLGLPVVPFTVMAEMLAQAAALLAPDRVVVGLRDVQANRWLAYEESPIALELHATRDAAAPDEVVVRLRPRPAGENRKATGEATFRGVVLFSHQRPSPKDASLPPLTEARLCRFSADELYRDQWLFHGAGLQALTHVGNSCRDGIEGTLEVLPRRALFPASLWPTLHTDPIVLDAFTHLLGTWGIDKQAGNEGDVMFPLRLASLSIDGADPDEGTSLGCRIQIRDVGRHRVLADAEILRPDGRVWMSLTGWEDWRFHWPGRYRDVFRDPKTFLLGEVLSVRGSTEPIVVWLEPPADMGRPIWRDVLLWTQLSPRERMALRDRADSEESRNAMLFQRIAAKEAVRRFLLAQGEPAMYPADLETTELTDGRIRVESRRPKALKELPIVSVAGTDIAAVAFLSGDASERIGLALRNAAPNQPARELFAEAARRAWACVSHPEQECTFDVETRDEVSGVVTFTTSAGTKQPSDVERRGEFVWAWTKASWSDL